MSKIDPEQLEREAEELMVKHGLIPDPNEDTPAEPAAEPAPQADTPPEPPASATDDENPRGEGEKSVDDETEISVLRERYKNAQAAMTRATERASNAEKLVADLRRENAELRASPPTQQAPQNADEAEELLQQALKEYPEIVKPLLARLERVEATAKTATTEVEQRKIEDAEAAHLSAIQAVHKDVTAIASSDEFVGWVSRQTPYWRNVADKGTVEEVCELLDRYKAAVGLTDEAPPQRETAIERAKKVAEPTLPRGRKPDPNGTKRTWTRKEIGALSLEDFEKHRDEIDRAYVEGRVR